MPRVTRSSQRPSTSTDVIVQDFIQVNHSGRSYITLKEETYEGLLRGVTRLLKTKGLKLGNVALSAKLPSFGDVLLEIDPAAWPALREHVNIVHVQSTPSGNSVVSSSTPRSIRLVVFPPNGRGEFSIHPASSASVQHVKAMIGRISGYEPDSLRLVCNGSRLDERWSLSSCDDIDNGSEIYAQIEQRGGKPVIYLFTPMPTDVTVRLSLVPAWSFSALYPSPSIGQVGGNNIVWDVNAQPGSVLKCKHTGSEVAYLYWEARTNSTTDSIHSTLPPLSPHHPSNEFNPASAIVDPDNSILLSIEQVPKYLDDALLSLGLHTEARTSFITYWLPSLLKHAHVALRFLPQREYEAAAPMEVSPPPTLVTRVFMLFKGIPEDSCGDWLGNHVFDWADIVGVRDANAVCNGDGLRVLEWGGMEVLEV